MRRDHAPILDTRSNESSSGVIVSKDTTLKNLLKKTRALSLIRFWGAIQKGIFLTKKGIFFTVERGAFQKGIFFTEKGICFTVERDFFHPGALMTQEQRRQHLFEV